MKGKLTFDAEGMEGGKWHSRKLHVPSDSSGITIGRGYDLKVKSPQTVLEDLVAVGIPVMVASILSKAGGLSGAAARYFIVANNLENLEISKGGQVTLFNVVYSRLEYDVIRICNKRDVVRIYGRTDWSNLDERIRDMLVDLRFRGDYTPASRRLLQRFVAANDLDRFAAVIMDESKWQQVPRDRVRRRKEYMVGKEIVQS